MATHWLPILGHHTRPDDTAGAWFEPADILGSNDNTDRMILRLAGAGGDDATQPTIKEGIHGGFYVPKNFVGTAKIIVLWYSTKTTGNVVFDFDYRAIGGDDAESYDQATWQESVTVTDGAGSAINERMVCEFTLTSSNLAVDDDVQFFFGRDGADAADTLAGSALVSGLIFQYADA